MQLHFIKIITTGILFTMLSGIFTSSSAQTNSQKISTSDSKSKISILGTFHFGSTGDVAAVKVENIMSERRQKEIRQMLKKIKAYNPTKVLIEVVRNKN